MYPCVQPWTEIFYDGEVKVVDNVAIVNRPEHRDTLLMRGFEEVPFEEEVEASAETSSEVPQAEESAEEDVEDTSETSVEESDASETASSDTPSEDEASAEKPKRSGRGRAKK